MAKILKQVRCGRLVSAVVYTTPTAGDTPKARAQKQKTSTAARERLNARTSFQKLERCLADNFDNGDLFVTLTYNDKYLPEDRDRAVRRARCFLSKLRGARKARGWPLRYIYVTEGCCPGGRIHHHLVLNSTGDDLEELRHLWERHRDLWDDLRKICEDPELVRPGKFSIDFGLQDLENNFLVEKQQCVLEEFI